MTVILQIKTIYGNCPVQAEGTVRSRKRGSRKMQWYFRARGNRWSFEVSENLQTTDPSWRYEEPYGEEPFAAGWMEQAEAIAFINKAANLWVKEQD